MGNKFDKRLEKFSKLEAEFPCFVRLDGWNFHSLTKKLKLRKPFDKSFTQKLVKVAKSFFLPFNPVLCYLFSDEVSFLFDKPTSFRRVEKIDSIFAGKFSSQFSLLIETEAAFDCRVVPIKNVLEYLVWRQAECYRNHNNVWSQWVLQKGLSPKQTDKKLRGLKTKDLFILCKKHKINLNKTPEWQRNGVLLHWRNYKKEGYDPIQKKRVEVDRRNVIADWKTLRFGSIEGRKYIENLLRN